MAATKTIAINDDSCLRLYYDLNQRAVPAAFAAAVAANVFIADDCDKACHDAHTDAAYVQFSIGRQGKVFRFSYVVGGITYTIDLLTSEIGSMQITA